MEDDIVRTVLVIAAVDALSSASMMAFTYDCLVGTSIWEIDCLKNKNITAYSNVGARGTKIKKTLEGMCVITIVFNKPIRFANMGARKMDMAVIISAKEKIRAKEINCTLNLKKNHVVSKVFTIKPPPNASIENKEVSFRTVFRDCGWRINLSELLKISSMLVKLK